MESGTLSLPRKRKPHQVKSSKVHKHMKSHPGTVPNWKKPSKKMTKFFQKRARDYNSDDSSDGEQPGGLDVLKGVNGSENEEENQSYDTQQGVTKFTEGCRAFKTAFLTIMKSMSIDPLGPVLSAHKKLVAEKLAEEETDHKAKSVIKREKYMAAEKGHVKPAGFLDAKEKLLISVATKGVVKLFNAVNKAQNPQKGLNVTKSKDTKALEKLRKETFLSELKKSTAVTTFNSSKMSHLNKANDDEPGWAPLRDSYMLTSSKLKDWDKMGDPASVSEHNDISDGSSSDDD